MRHPSVLLRSVSVVTALLLILTALISPTVLSGIELPLLFLSVFLIGIPHGAIDHIMASEIFNLKRTLHSHLLFYGSYLLIMLFVGALWVFFPIVGMILFLLISVYHFGQADMEDFMDAHRGGFDRMFHTIRGVLIIGCIIFSDLTMTIPVMADAMGLSENQLMSWMPDATIALSVIIAIYALSIVAGMLQKRFSSPLAVIFDSILLVSLFLLTGPFVGFAVYFALWHSAGHVQEMREYFHGHQKELSLGRFYWLATPFTLISIVGLFLLWGLNQVFMLEEQMITLMFILISVLTLPHMLIVDRMYENPTATYPQ